MGFVVKSETTDLSYQIFFKEPLLELMDIEPRRALVGKFLKAFKLRLDDIKFNEQTASNDWIHFSKFYGPTFFNVSFGLEQVLAVLQIPVDEAQVKDLYGKLLETFKHSPISRQYIVIRRQLSTKEDSSLFLKSLNPHCPSKFKKLLDGRGVFYTLRIPDHNLRIHITLVNSLLIEVGLYLSVENDFTPNLYTFKDTFKVTKEYDDLILEQLNLTIKEEI